MTARDRRRHTLRTSGSQPAAGDIAGTCEVRDATGTGRPWPPHGPASDLAGPPEIPERWRNLAIGLADHACPKRLMAR